MKYHSARAFRDALENRLSADQRASGLPIARFRKRVAFERFLARLVVVAPEGWALKGAVALDFRIGAPARTTDDVDLGASGRALVDDAIRAARAHDLGDFFSFDVTGPSEKRYDDLTTLRYSVAAKLDARIFESFHVDVGLTREFNVTPELVPMPAMLAFADFKQVVVPTIRIEEHLADKLHALSRLRVAGVVNTRVKDLADVVLVLATPEITIDQGRLAQAIVTLFDQRTTHELPAGIPDPPSLWNENYARMTTEMGLEPRLRLLTNGIALARETFDPALARAREIRDSRR